ncbi:polymeric immunoglobulin receptor-like [Clarias gariepinus]
MRGLKKSDAGWYWCSVGDLQFPVHVSVSDDDYSGVASQARIPIKQRKKVTVTDNPAESLFTVTIHNLNTGDTGWYWCAVEIDRGTDISEYLHITVKQDPDLSVDKSSVIGKEGAIITVQCLYSTAYRNTQKQWCRFKDRHCITFKTETFWDSRIQLSDDGRRFLSVNMSRLKKSDAGWYWCSAGDLQVPVLIEVNNSAASTNKANDAPAERKSKSENPVTFCIADSKRT